MSSILLPEAKIEYPDSDGLPMADNTQQFRWIALQARLRVQPDTKSQ